MCNEADCVMDAAFRSLKDKCIILMWCWFNCCSACKATA
jgi:hypothetical protein